MTTRPAPDHGDLAATGTASPTPGVAAATARAAVIAALEQCDVAVAAWEAGSAAFGRADESSDLDVAVLCDPDAGGEVLDAIEQHLRELDPRLVRWDVGRSTFGVQRFWRPAVGVAEPGWCMVDTSVMELDRERDLWQELLRPERHGRALELYDPTDVLARARRDATFDVDAHRRRIAEELAAIADRHAMFADFPAKELSRGRVLDAHAMYHAMVVTPLVTLLGMLHRPLRFDFGQRYLHVELPPDVVERLAPTIRPGLQQLEDQLRRGTAWIDSLLATIDPDALPIEGHAEQMRIAFG